MAMDPCSTPFTAEAENNLIIIEGGDGVSATLTVDAARESADNIMDQVTLAMGQAVMDKARYTRPS